MSYRVVYGETMPAWERLFPTLQEATRFAIRQQACGDVVFSITQAKPGDPPAALMRVTTPHTAHNDDGPEAA